MEGVTCAQDWRVDLVGHFQFVMCIRLCSEICNSG